MVNFKFIFAVITATGASAFNHGFNAALFNIITAVLTEWYLEIIEKRNLAEGEYEGSQYMVPIICAVFPLGGAVGSLLIFPLVNIIGRKNSIICTNFVTLIGVFLQHISQLFGAFEILIVGRFIVGVSAGLATGATLIYLIEISRYCIRGAVGAFYSVMVSASSALAYVLGLKSTLGDLDNWHHSFILCYIPCAIQIFTLPFCPESPKYLYFDREDEDEAEESLAWLRDDDIEEELADYQEEGEALRDVGPVSFGRIFTDQTLRSPMIISVFILLGHRLSGIDVALYYSTYFLITLGFELDSASTCSIFLAVTKLVGSIISMFIVDKIGRVPLLLGSFAGMIGSLSVLCLITLLSRFDSVPDSVNTVAVVFLFLYVFSFSFGAGTIPWLYAAELNIQPARTIVMGLGMTLNWIAEFLVVAFFPPLLYLIGNFLFLLYIFFNLMSIAFIALTMRETMGLETVDIVDLFYD